LYFGASLQLTICWPSSLLMAPSLMNNFRCASPFFFA
jgi:hypothetical protein